MAGARVITQTQANFASKSLKELFVQLKPDYNNPNTFTILKDIIHIIVRDSMNNYSEDGLFNCINICDTINKYIEMYLQTKDKTVLNILLSILLETYNYEYKINSPRYNIIMSIYNDIISIV